MLKVIIVIILFALVIREIIIRKKKKLKHKTWEEIKYGYKTTSVQH